MNSTLDACPDVITFDCYGTLVDWDRGIRSAFEQAASASGRSVDAAALLAAYGEIEPIVEAERYRRYRDVMAETARRAAARFDWDLSDEQATGISASLPSWPVFPDTVASLRSIERAGCRLGILSNVDRDLLHGTLANLPVAFDLVITAEDVRSYKPAVPHFESAKRAVGDGRWLHAAQSYFHDVRPAMSMGIDVVWINRNSEVAPDGAGPRQLEDLRRLATWIEEF